MQLADNVITEMYEFPTPYTPAGIEPTSFFSKYVDADH
jgi:hypothetical protein